MNNSSSSNSSTAGTMRMIVKILGGQECSVEVTSTTPVQDVKKELSVKMDVPVERQKLVFKGKTMLDNSKVGDYALEDGAKVHLVVSKVATTVPPVSSLAGAAVVKSAPSAAATTRNADSSAIDFWLLLSNVLQKHFAPEDVEKIVEEYKKDLEAGLQSLNLDDIDRMAHTILEGQQHHSQQQPPQTPQQSRSIATTEAVPS